MVELECIPYGVGHADEGVCLLLRMGPYRILLDCGLKEIAPLQSLTSLKNLPPQKQAKLPADLVLCSHAHPDHAQGLLALHQAFPQLPIYSSEVTTHLLPLNWPELDPRAVPGFCRALPWRSPLEFGDGLTAQLFPAGHLPGAAAFLLSYTPPLPTQNRAGQAETFSVFYTGDFFLSNSRLVEGLPLAELRGISPDVLILEGTFGTARHPHRRQQENQLAERITQALNQGFCIMLPVPILGLGQELLMLLRSHHYFTGRDFDIWVDGAIAAGCDAYLEILPHLPTTVQNFAQHQPLFWDQRVRPRVQRLQPEARSKISQVPCIVLADKTVDMQEYCDPEGHPWLVLLPQQPTSMAAVEVSATGNGQMDLIARLQPLLRSNQLRLETYLLAQHCDGPGTTQLIHNLRPQHVIFIHGSPTYLADLTALDELNNRYHLHSPGVGTQVELPVGKDWVQSPPTPAIDARYEGELNQLGPQITITLPGAIAQDPRWQAFADTGLIQASWQGDALVLRGLNQRELLLESSRFAETEINCCGTCRHFRSQRCWNQASPLFGFKVTPDGYCPAFEPLPISTLEDQDDQ